MFYYTINSHSCKQHDVLRKCDVFLSGFSMKQSCFTVFSPFRQSKVITSHWEACAEQVLRPGHPGSLYLRPGSDQQPGDAADQPTLPAQHRTLQPPGLPGSCSLSAGCYYTDCHSSATGQSSTYLLWGLKKKNIHVCCYFCCSFCCFTSKSLQVHKYGLLLLQSTPPHICVSDLGRRIASIPGVQAVHNLHVWQLTESFTVASVHVHCHAGFPAHRWSGKSLYYFLYHGHWERSVLTSCNTKIRFNNWIVQLDNYHPSICYDGGGVK